MEESILFLTIRSFLPTAIILIIWWVKVNYFPKRSSITTKYGWLLMVIALIALISYLVLNTLNDGINLPTLTILAITYFILLTNTIIFNKKFQLAYTIRAVKHDYTMNIITGTNYMNIQTVYVPFWKCISGNATKYVSEKNQVDLSIDSKYRLDIGNFPHVS